MSDLIIEKSIVHLGFKKALKAFKSTNKETPDALICSGQNYYCLIKDFWVIVKTLAIGR